MDEGREDSVQPGLEAVQGILFFAVCCGVVIMIQWVMVNHIKNRQAAAYGKEPH